MKKYTHVEQFYQVIRSVKEFYERTEEQIRGVTFRGTVKLHGSNSGVACRPEGLTAQSREIPITVKDDHFGFAKFVAVHEDVFRKIEAGVRAQEGIDPETVVTLFGEHCGKGIQKGCGIHKITPKQFVLFAVAAGDGEDSRYLDAVPSLGDKYAEAGVYSIMDAPTWTLDVDFSDKDSLKAAAEKATEYTLTVEEQCPWAARFGAEGIGEGIVWIPVGDQWGNTYLYFKTKGDKHKKESCKSKVIVPLDPAVLENIEAFVAFAVTEDRLQQGLDELAAQGLDVNFDNIGTYLKWVAQDVSRECAAELEVNKLTWKDVFKEVTYKARAFFVEKVTQI